MFALRRIFAAALLISVTAGPALAQDALIPAKRFVLTQDADLSGGDLSTQLDTTLEACERACTADQRCTHFTFNTRNGSCFPKQDPDAEAFYQGALSGRLVLNDPAISAAATERRAELSFLSDSELGEALVQAQGLANRHTSGAWSDEEHLASAREREAAGDLAAASDFAGAAVNASDKAQVWGEYARLLFEAAGRDQNNAGEYRNRAILASINAYLRASNKAVRHNALVVLAQAMEGQGRGGDAVKALRLAQAQQPRDETASLLEDYAGKYGFRILETDVQSNNARPRICVNLSESLVESGLDYTPFVQLPEAGLTVQPGGWRQLCVDGVSHGKPVFLGGFGRGDGAGCVQLNHGTASHDFKAFVETYRVCFAAEIAVDFKK